MIRRYIGREVREFAEQNGWAWTRAERRRLARSDAAPGRRFATRQPKTKPRGNAFSRDAVETMARLAVPGLRRRDVQIRVPDPGRVVVELSGPRADAETVAAVWSKLKDYTPVCVLLDVVAVGGSR